MRWRPLKDDIGNEMKDENGVVLKESNSRMVRWSDGRYVFLSLPPFIINILTYLNIEIQYLYLLCFCKSSQGMSLHIESVEASLINTMILR